MKELLKAPPPNNWKLNPSTVSITKTEKKIRKELCMKILFTVPFKKIMSLFSHLHRRYYCSPDLFVRDWIYPTVVQHGMTFAMWSFDSIKMSGQRKVSILWFAKASSSHKEIQDELPVIELGSGSLNRERSLPFTCFLAFLFRADCVVLCFAFSLWAWV